MHQPAATTPPPVAKPAVPTTPRVYRVGEIVRLAARALESRFTEVWVEGEASNVKQPGHLYFTLKDGEAQLPAVMWRSDAQRLKFRVTDGLKLRVRGRLTIYEGQGKFQISVEHVEPAGLGALQLAFEQLKKKLAAEGLFDGGRKRKLPYLPRRIGIATSPTGAAVRDMIRVIERRGPARIVVAPCQVQGDAAPSEIVRAIRWLQRQPEIDVILVGRGGGSIEDLWAFNDEAVARAIAACKVPVISAVGHEVDFTIADFVADVRAATPSQAAEIVMPMHAELVHRREELERRLQRAGRRLVGQARQGLDATRERLLGVLHRSITAQRRQLSDLHQRLERQHPRARLARDRATLDRARAKLTAPVADRLARGRRELAQLEQRLHAAMQQALAARHKRFVSVAGKLDALSPLKVLDRGYALVRLPSGEVVRRADRTQPGDTIEVRLGRGSLAARVERVDGGDDE